MEETLWLWQDPERRFTSDVFKFVRDNYKNRKDLVILYTNQSPSIDNGFTLTEYMLQLCRTISLFDNERTTYLSYKDHLLALELCISQVRKKNGDDSDITKDDVLECHNMYKSICLDGACTDDKQSKYIDAYKEFLSHSNCTEIWNLYNLIKDNVTLVKNKISEFAQNTVFLVLGGFESDIFVLLTKFLTSGESAFNIVIESPLNSSFDNLTSDTGETSSINITKESVELAEILTSAVPKVDLSATMEYGEEVLLSFLCLLVNCRNELALSKAMSSPIVALSHSAFTDLKHVALRKEMPMCQTVISYVTRIHLGGKGYAPSKDCPLLGHLKGLRTFVDLINKLQTVLEEESNTQLAIEKVINIIKKRLLNAKKDLRESSIRDSADILQKASQEILKRDSFTSEYKGSTQINQKAFDVLHCLINYRTCLLPCSDPNSKSSSSKKMKRTPLNLPPLLGYFRTPDEESCSQDSSSRCSLITKNAKVEQTELSLPCLSYFHSTNSNSSQQRVCAGETTPRKTTFKDCLRETDVGLENEIPKKIPMEKKGLSFSNNINKKVGVKRSILKDIPKANKKVKPNTVIKTQVAKKKQLIKGQGQITTFFLQK